MREEGREEVKRATKFIFKCFGVLIHSVFLS